MKKTLHLTILFFALLGFGLTKAQPCTVDPQYTSPGIYPSDTLADMFVNDPTNQVIQFVFPEDTVVFGQTIPFDSFRVSSVSNVPVGVQWECNLNHPTCSYVTTPGQLTRGCVKVFGTPTSLSAGQPNYDSLIVTGVAYFTLFGSSQSIASDIPVYYRVLPSVGVNDAMEALVNLEVKPNPATENTWATYYMPSAGSVSLSLYDVLGQEVLKLQESMVGVGTHAVKVDTDKLGEGIYFLRLEMNGGEFTTTQKIVTLK